MADGWTFRCYLDANGVDVVDAWSNGQEPSLQAKVDQRLRHLRQQPRDKWSRPHFDTLHGSCAGLGELRLEHKGVQWRLLGFASAEMEYTWLFVAREVGDKFVPKDTCSLAKKRRSEVALDRKRADDCDFD